LDRAEARLREEHGPALKQTARETFQQYAQRNDYAIEHIWQDARGPFVERDAGSVRVRVEWPELTALFEFGVSPHTIRGDPVLTFYWDEIDQWVTTESVEWGSRTGGIPEARAIRRSLRLLEQDLRR
jgi:hypothetical protein